MRPLIVRHLPLIFFYQRSRFKRQPFTVFWWFDTLRLLPNHTYIETIEKAILKDIATERFKNSFDMLTDHAKHCIDAQRDYFELKVDLKKCIDFEKIVPFSVGTAYSSVMYANIWVGNKEREREERESYAQSAQESIEELERGRQWVLGSGRLWNHLNKKYELEY